MYKNSAKFHLRPARMYIHVVLLIFLICMLVLALDQSQTDAAPPENQGDLQALHPGERRTTHNRLRKVKGEKQKVNLGELILTASPENNNIHMNMGCSSFNADSSENLLNKNYIRLINSDKLKDITVLNYVRNNYWDKLPPAGNKHIKPYGNKFPLANLLNNVRFDGVTQLNENNMSLDNNFISIPEKNEVVNINGLLESSSTISTEKESDGNNIDIGSSNSVDISNDSKTTKALHKAALKSSENDQKSEEKVIKTQILSKHDSDITENLTDEVKKNVSFLQKLLEYYKGQYKSYGYENKGILSQTENINNVLQLPDPQFKNLFSSNYYTGGGFFSKKHFDPINKRLYVLPVIIPESYLANLMLINPSLGKCLLKNNVPKNLSSELCTTSQRYNGKTFSLPKSSATINYKKTSGSCKSMLVKTTCPLGEISHTETIKCKNTKNFDSTSLRTVTKNNKELTRNVLPSKRLQNMIQNVSLLETATKISTGYDYIDNYQKSKKNHLAVTPVLNKTNVNNVTINADFIKIINKVLKFLNESKYQNISELQRKENNTNREYLKTTTSKTSIKVGKQIHRIPSSKNMVEIRNEIQVKDNECDNITNNKSLLIEEMEPHKYDKINDLKKYDRLSIFPETPNIESLIIKYENITIPKRTVVHSESSESSNLKLIRSLDSNDKTPYTHDTDHQIKECQQKSKDEVSNYTKIYSFDKKPDNAIRAVEYNNTPVTNYFKSALQKHSCNSTTNENNTKIIILDGNSQHKPIKLEYLNKILNRIYNNNSNSNGESLSKNNNENFETSHNNILMKKLSPANSSLGKICVRGPENLTPGKVDIIFPGLVRTILKEVQPRDIYFVLQNDPETSGRKTQDRSFSNKNELPTSKSTKQQNILEQLKRMNETLMKLREDINNGLFDKNNRTKNI